MQDKRPVAFAGKLDCQPELPESRIPAALFDPGGALTEVQAGSCHLRPAQPRADRQQPAVVGQDLAEAGMLAIEAYQHLDLIPEVPDQVPTRRRLRQLQLAQVEKSAVGCVAPVEKRDDLPGLEWPLDSQPEERRDVAPALLKPIAKRPGADTGWRQ